MSDSLKGCYFQQLFLNLYANFCVLLKNKHRTNITSGIIHLGFKKCIELNKETMLES